MRSTFDLSEMANLAQSVAFFNNDLLHQLSGLKKIESVKEWIEAKKIDFTHNGTYQTWAQNNIYCFLQTWGSTACGWGGMGGAAMTTTYTVAIHNEYFGIIAVFWGGRLAYCVEANDKAVQLLRENGMPGYSHMKDLKVIYRTTTRNNY